MLWVHTERNITSHHITKHNPVPTGLARGQEDKHWAQHAVARECNEGCKGLRESPRTSIQDSCNHNFKVMTSDDIIRWSYHVFDFWCLLSIQGCAFPRWLVWISTMQICSQIDLLNVQRSPSFHIFVRSWLCPLLFPALAFCGRSETYLLLTASFRWTAKLLKAKLETSSKSKPRLFCCAHRSVFESYSYTVIRSYRPDLYRWCGWTKS